MAVEHILGLVAFIVIVLALSLLLPIGSRRTSGANGGDGGSSTAWTDASGGDCGSSDGGGCDGGGGD